MAMLNNQRVCIILKSFISHLRGEVSNLKEFNFVIYDLVDWQQFYVDIR